MNKFIYFTRKFVFPNLAVMVFVTGLVVTTSVGAYKLTHTEPSVTEEPSVEASSRESNLVSNDSQIRGPEIDEPEAEDLNDEEIISNITQAEPKKFSANSNSSTEAAQIAVQTKTIVQNPAPAQASTGAFTAATLATHNKAGDCYIAYSGKVYDVSNSSAWSGCSHHGAHGGTDITAFFPHPVSYFNSLPVVGDYSGGTVASNNPVIRGGDDEDDGEDEYEDEGEYGYEDD